MTAEELQAIWEKQVSRLISLGFNREVGKSEFTYRRMMPQFAPQPQAYIGRFDIPLLVDPRISLKQLHKLAGIHSMSHEEQIVDVVKVPDVPYAVWTHDGNRYRMHSVKEAISHFQPDELPSPLVEVIALYLQHPEFFQDHGIDATGSVFGMESVPCIDTFLGSPELNIGAIDHPDNRWGALSRGSSIQIQTNPAPLY